MKLYIQEKALFLAPVKLKVIKCINDIDKYYHNVDILYGEPEDRYHVYNTKDEDLANKVYWEVRTHIYNCLENSKVASIPVFEEVLNFYKIKEDK